MSLFVSKSAMDDFLDRQIVNCHGYYGNKKEVYKEALLAVKSFAKTENCIEAEPVVHGHWVLLDTSDENGSLLGCSSCHDCRMFYYTDAMGTAYCPTCGAKMDEVEK